MLPSRLNLIAQLIAPLTLKILSSMLLLTNLSQGATPKKLSVSVSKITSLQNSFKQAKPMTRQQLKFHSSKSWDCELYGMRSRTKVKNKVKLYKLNLQKFSQRKNISPIVNKGSQVIKSYETSKEGLTGSLGHLKDVIRITKNNSLISELSLAPTPSRKSRREVKSVIDSKRSVIAYAFCK